MIGSKEILMQDVRVAYLNYFNVRAVESRLTGTVTFSRYCQEVEEMGDIKIVVEVSIDGTKTYLHD